MLSSRRKSTATRGKFRTGELRAQALHLQRIARIPVEVEFPGHIRDGGLRTAPLHDGQKDTRVVTREMADAPRASIVPDRMTFATASEDSFLSVKPVR